jgi:hypothetical protein
MDCSKLFDYDGNETQSKLQEFIMV